MTAPTSTRLKPIASSRSSTTNDWRDEHRDRPVSPAAPARPHKSGRIGAGSDRGGSVGGARRVVRCAIYTRKSSEEGLEQAFNSLDAQREACEAYVRSQQHEGWTVLPTLFDDGGFSGGTMERPALRRLLADIRAGNVDVVVVYKIDRLTRSLFDFAKIVETFDAAQASFVSITQSFNTTSSMGRLTLNVLLSFAQFEREVTGERIRDKIALSKRKGMWMGGNVPLGYDLKHRKLVINEAEADTVRTIFRLYAEDGSVRKVKQELDQLGLRTKARAGTDIAGTSSTRAIGNQSFGIGHLHTVLRNPLYIGMVRHKGELHRGEHQAIVAADLWDAVQRRLDNNAIDRQHGRSGKAPSLLTGRIFDANGCRLTPSHAVKGTKRYRYYVTGGRDLASDATLRIPAADIEAIVVTLVRDLLLDQNRIVDVAGGGRSPAKLRAVIKRADQMAVRLADQTNPEHAALLRAIVDRVSVAHTTVRVSLDRRELVACLQNGVADGSGRLAGGIGVIDHRTLGLDDANRDQQNIANDELDPIVLEQTISLCRRGREQRLVLVSASAPPDAAPDAAMIKAFVRARSWFSVLKERHVDSIADLGRRENVARTIVSHHLPLAFLAPDIIEAVIQGRQPFGMTIEQLIIIAAASPIWDRQRAMFRQN